MPTFVKLPRKFHVNVQEWLETKTKLRELEKIEKSMNKSLKEAVKAALTQAQVNDQSSFVEAGSVILHLEHSNPVYGAEVTKDMVGTRPLIRSGYETLKVTPKAA